MGARHTVAVATIGIGTRSNKAGSVRFATGQVWGWRCRASERGASPTATANRRFILFSASALERELRHRRRINGRAVLRDD